MLYFREVSPDHKVTPVVLPRPPLSPLWPSHIEYSCLSTAPFPLSLSQDPQLCKGRNHIFLGPHCPSPPSTLLRLSSAWTATIADFKDADCGF